MRLDVRPVGEAGAVTVLLPVGEVGVGDIGAHEDRRRLDGIELIECGSAMCGSFPVGISSRR